jgi:hypothetical protein
MKANALSEAENRGGHSEVYGLQPYKVFIGVIANKLAPRSRVLLEKLAVAQPFKKFPAFYATRRFIAEFKRALS